MRYTLYLHPFGEVTINLDTVDIHRHLVFVVGYDSNHNRVRLMIDKLCRLNDYPCDYGYCHIVSYTAYGITTPCNIYASLG